MSTRKKTQRTGDAAKQTGKTISTDKTIPGEVLPTNIKAWELLEKIGDYSHIPDVEEFFSNTLNEVKQKYQQQIQEFQKQKNGRTQMNKKIGEINDKQCKTKQK